MNKISCIVVDDEPLARSNLKAAIYKHPKWEVLDEIGNATQVKKRVLELDPDVVFLDIKMPEKNGLDCAKDVMEVKKSIKIIFVTAYDEYALQAFELFALDYLLKPFNDQRFEVAVRRAESMLTNNRHLIEEQNGRLIEDKKYLNKVIINSSNSVRIIDLDKVFWFQASGNYVEVVHTEGTHLHRISLSFLENHLDPDVFVRSHRSSIVRISEIKEIKSLGNDQFELLMSNKDKVKITSRYRNELLEKIR